MNPYKKERAYHTQDQQTQQSGPRQHKQQQSQARLHTSGAKSSSTERPMPSRAHVVTTAATAAVSSDRMKYREDDTGKYDTSKQAHTGTVGYASNSLRAPAPGARMDPTPEDLQQKSAQPKASPHSTQNEAAVMTSKELSAELDRYKHACEQQLSNMQWQLQIKDDQLQQLKEEAEAANQVSSGTGRNTSQLQGAPVVSTRQGTLQQLVPCWSGNSWALVRGCSSSQTADMTDLKAYVKKLELELKECEQKYNFMQWQRHTQESEITQLRKAAEAANQVLPGCGQNYAQLKGVVDASYPRDMVSSRMRNTLNRSLQKLATCILEKYKQCAASNSDIKEDVEAVLDPVLRFIDPAVYNERIQKMALKSHLLHKLDQIVWNSSEPASDLEQQLHARLLTALPPFQLRKAVLHNAPALKAAETPGSSSRVVGNPAQLQLLNKLLDGQRQLSAWWYDAMTSQQGAAAAAGGQQQLQGLLQPVLLEFLQCLGLSSLHMCDDVVDNLGSVVSDAVLLRLCAEASHPCHALKATAGSPSHTDPELFGGVDEACKVYQGSQDSANIGEQARVVACAAPGVVHDARLMLLPSSAEQPMQLQDVVIVTWEGA